MAKSEHVNLPRAIRVDAEIHEYLQTWAEFERRSVANLIGVIIEKAVQERKHEEAMVKRVNG